jgi:hypothetical protein
MIKVLKAGGMKRTAVFKQVTTKYFYKDLKVYFVLYSLTHMISFLEVFGESEESILEGLALVSIAINRALINVSFPKALSKYYKNPRYDLVQFLLL